MMAVVGYRVVGIRACSIGGNLTRGLLRCTPGYKWVTPMGLETNNYRIDLSIWNL